MKYGPQAKRSLIAQRLEDLLLGAEVIVEGARRERGRPNDVADRSCAVAEFRKDAAGRIQNDAAILLLDGGALACRTRARRPAKLSVQVRVSCQGWKASRFPRRL